MCFMNSHASGTPDHTYEKLYGAGCQRCCPGEVPARRTEVLCAGDDDGDIDRCDQHLHQHQPSPRYSQLVILLGHLRFTAHATTDSAAPTKNAHMRFLYSPLAPYTLVGPITPNSSADEKNVVCRQGADAWGTSRPDSRSTGTSEGPSARACTGQARHSSAN